MKKLRGIVKQIVNPSLSKAKGTIVGSVLVRSVHVELRVMLSLLHAVRSSSMSAGTTAQAAYSPSRC